MSKFSKFITFTKSLCLEFISGKFVTYMYNIILFILFIMLNLSSYTYIYRRRENRE